MTDKYSNKDFRKWAFGRIKSIHLGADYWNKNHGYLYKTKYCYVSNGDIEIMYKLWAKHNKG